MYHISFDIAAAKNKAALGCAGPALLAAVEVCSVLESALQNPGFLRSGTIKIFSGYFQGEQLTG